MPSHELSAKYDIQALIVASNADKTPVAKRPPVEVTIPEAMPVGTARGFAEDLAGNLAPGTKVVVTVPGKDRQAIRDVFTIEFRDAGRAADVTFVVAEPVVVKPDVDPVKAADDAVTMANLDALQTKIEKIGK